MFQSSQIQSVTSYQQDYASIRQLGFSDNNIKSMASYSTVEIPVVIAEIARSLPKLTKLLGFLKVDPQNFTDKLNSIRDERGVKPPFLQRFNSLINELSKDQFKNSVC